MDKELNKIITVMKQTHGRDISLYDQSFLLKSLERRWTATGVNNNTEYCSCLEKNNTEADILYNSLHITFSHFFRNPLTFAVLEQSILPSLVSQKPEGSEIRVWSAGCAKGQEAYSMAILLSDLSEALGKEINFRIFSTDISREALTVARAGVYKQNEMQNVQIKHLNKYFIKKGKTFTILPHLRQCINFSIYDLLDQSTANPPESIYGDFDIVMCCNLLFYYKSDLQQVIIKKLQQAMSADGYLVTGETEKIFVESASKLQMIAISTTIFKNNERRGI